MPLTSPSSTNAAAIFRASPTTTKWNLAWFLKKRMLMLFGQVTIRGCPRCGQRFSVANPNWTPWLNSLTQKAVGGSQHSNPEQQHTIVFKAMGVTVLIILWDDRCDIESTVFVQLISNAGQVLWSTCEMGERLGFSNQILWCQQKLAREVARSGSLPTWMNHSFNHSSDWIASFHQSPVWRTRRLFHQASTHWSARRECVPGFR